MLETLALIAVVAAAADVISRRASLPLPILLLAAGVAMGPEGTGWIDPGATAELVDILLPLVVALILFEGATRLNLSFLRSEAPIVRNLILIGVPGTALLGGGAAHLLLGMDWGPALLFGAIVSVTGPSVISPLVKRLRLDRRTESAILGEGIIIDPVAALVAIVIAEISLAKFQTALGPVEWVAQRFATGIAVGIGAALIAAFAIRLLPRASRTEVALIATSVAIGAFVLSESIAHESGLVTMVILGAALGNIRLPHREALDDFQESTTAYLLATIYVVLAARVVLDDVAALWPGGFVLVALMLFVVRPIIVAVAGWRTAATPQTKVFLAAVAPRGVVAAALAALLVTQLEAELGLNGGRFTALVFLTISASIAIQLGYAGPLARYLGLLPLRTVIIGYGDIGSRVARELVNEGEDVAIIDRRAEAAEAARLAGFRVIEGDGRDVDVLEAADVESARAVLVLTGHDDRNLLAAQLAMSAGCERIVARVSDVSNLDAFRRLNVSVVNAAEALATDVAQLIRFEDATQPVEPALPKGMHLDRLRISTQPANVRLEDLLRAGELSVLSVERGDRTGIPALNERVESGDVITVFGSADAIQQARIQLGHDPDVRD